MFDPEGQRVFDRYGAKMFVKPYAECLVSFETKNGLCSLCMEEINVFAATENNERGFNVEATQRTVE